MEQSKKRRRKVYRSKKKAIKHDKHYVKLCEEGMKKRYRSIFMKSRLPVGTVEADTEEDLIIHTGNHDDNQHQSFSNMNEMEDNEVKTEGFNSVLIPIEEKLPSELSDTAFISKTEEKIIQAQAEPNDALLLARYYRNVAEKLKVENEYLASTGNEVMYY